MKGLKRIILSALLLSCIANLTSAQRAGFGGGVEGATAEASAENIAGNEPMQPLPADREGVPVWPIDSNFKSDVFTFVRLRYTTVGRNTGFGFGTRGTGTSWLNDWPSSDLDLSFRLQQMTSLKVDPNPIQLQIWDERLFDYPFVYLIQVGRLEFTEDEVRILRRYLLNGGFLMVDDHWGLNDQKNWAEQIKRVFPDREQVELPLDHPIFHCVFDLKAKPQVPAIQRWYSWQRSGQPDRTWYNDDDPQPHYRAISDDKGRILVLQCANTDLGDGWEREGENEEFFHKFSEKQAYPIAINIIFYAMTH